MLMGAAVERARFTAASKSWQTLFKPTIRITCSGPHVIAATSGRQNYLLSTIGGIQTFITCTGLDEFVNNRFKIDQVFRIESGTCVEKSDIHN